MSKLLLLRNKLPFREYLDSIPGLIQWPLQETSGNVALARNFRVSGLTDSSQFPGTDVIVNGYFTTDSDWTKGDPAITIAAGVATWSGAQAGNADLTATVAPLTSDNRYRVEFTVSNYSAGNITPLCGTQTGTARSANGTYSEEIVANGTAFLLRGDSDFAGNIDNVIARQANPLNGDITGATVEQSFGGNIPYAYSFDGNNDYVGLPAATLNTIFDGSAGTVVIFVQIGNTSNFGWAIRFFADANNVINFNITDANTKLRIGRVAGGISIETEFTGLTTDKLYMCALTWDEGIDQLTASINSNGSPQSTIGTWVGSLASARTIIGAGSNVPGNLWGGLLSYAIIHPTRAMTATEIAEIYRRSGI